MPAKSRQLDVALVKVFAMKPVLNAAEGTPRFDSLRIKTKFDDMQLSVGITVFQVVVIVR